MAQQLLAAGIVLLAGLLRFASIGEKSLWFDEAYSLVVASRSLKDVALVAAAQDAHPPLYYLLLSLWIRVFGTGEVALRSVGAIASTVTVGGTWWLGRRLAGPVVGVLAAFITAVAPLQIQSAQEARMYPLLGFLTLASWAALLTALEGKRWPWAAYVTATVLMLYTHYLGFLSVAGQGLFALFLSGRDRQRWLVAMLVVLVLYLPWLGIFYDTLLSGRGWPFFRPQVGLGTLTGLLGLLSFGGHAYGFDGYFGGGTVSLVAELAILWPFLGLALVGFTAYRGDPQGFQLIVGYLILPVALAFLFSLRHNIFYARYFSFLLPIFAVLLATGVSCAGRVGREPRAVRLVLLLAFVAFNAPVLNDLYNNPKLHAFNWRGAATLLSERIGPEDLVVVIPASGRFPFQYYFKGPHRITPMTPREFSDMVTGRVPGDPAADARSQRVFRSYASRHKVMWIVASQPFPLGAASRLRELLEPVYDIRDVADFNGVAVIRTVRRAD